MLGNEQTRVRMEAESRLKELLGKSPGQVEKICYTTYRNNPDPEIRMRARSILIDYAVNWSRPYLGFRLMPSKVADDHGTLHEVFKISQIQDKSPAAAAGLLPGDVVRSVDKISLDSESSHEDFSHYIGTLTPETPVTLRYERMGKPLSVIIPLGHRAVRSKDSPNLDNARQIFLTYLKSKSNPSPPQNP